MAESNDRDSQRDRTLRLIKQQNAYESEGVFLGGAQSQQRKKGTGLHPRYNRLPKEPPSRR
jgi:hypothetical protein